MSSNRFIQAFVAALLATLAFVGVAVLAGEHERKLHPSAAQPSMGDVFHTLRGHTPHSFLLRAAGPALAESESHSVPQADLPFLDAASYAAVDRRVRHAEAPDRQFPAAKVSPRRAQARDPPHTI